MNGKRKASVFDEAVKPQWDFSKFKTVFDARKFYRGQISQRWDKTRTETDAGIIKGLENDAKDYSRQWRRYVQVAELNIDTSEPTLADYEQFACVLGTVPDNKRNPDHKPLWIQVDNFVKGWVNFNGDLMDTERFSRLVDYENFIRAMSDFGVNYRDVFDKAGLL